MIWDILVILVLILSGYKLYLYTKGYGWDEWKMYRITLNPLAGLISPNKAKSYNKNILLFEAIVGIIVALFWFTYLK